MAKPISKRSFGPKEEVRLRALRLIHISQTLRTFEATFGLRIKNTEAQE